MGRVPRHILVPRRKTGIWNSSLTLLNGQQKLGFFNWRSIYWFSIIFPSHLLTQKNLQIKTQKLSSVSTVSLNSTSIWEALMFEEGPNSLVYYPNLELKSRLRCGLFHSLDSFFQEVLSKKFSNFPKLWFFSTHGLLWKKKLGINYD